MEAMMAFYANSRALWQMNQQSTYLILNNRCQEALQPAGSASSVYVLTRLARYKLQAL